MYTSCVKCNGRLAVDEDGIGECSKCGTMQDAVESKQAIFAQLRIKGKNDRLCLSAFDDIVMKIVELPMEKITKKALIKKEREVSGNCIGYRILHKRLKEKHSLRVGRNVVMMLSALDNPEGAAARKGKKLRRRIYHSKGPDYIWHCDGYDKLKPFGFAIHGCIDGYSRRILWLHVSPSNNDPYIIAGYYLNCVEKLAGCPTILRTDRGTENTNIAFLQPFLRDQHDDPFAKEKSFMYGQSTSNQRIEAWWGQLRKNAAQWWMDYFKALRETGELDDSSEYHIDCL
ncbi:uncharacterized protein [Dysidea avara]|uniref:uncharacterized protein n=1 Tax=Dysidea avara TaxID=196820 RepID=UPI0033287933